MTEFSYPFFGNTTGDAGPYSAEQWRLVWESFMQNNYQLDGSYIPGTALGEVPPLEINLLTGLDFEIREGIALVKGAFYQSTTSIKYNVDANNNPNGYDRIDRMVLRLDYTAQTVRQVLLKGTAAASPSAPALTQNSSIYEVPLGQILVQEGASSLTASDVTDERIPARFFGSQSGGTGISHRDIGDGSILAGRQSSADWELVTPNTSSNSTPDFFISQTAEPGVLATPFIPAIAYLDGNYPFGSGFAHLDFQGIDNNQSFASLNNGGLELAAGNYLLKVHLYVYDKQEAGGVYDMRIQDITNAVTILEMSMGDGTDAAVEGAEFHYEDLFVSKNDTFVLEMQAQGTGTPVAVGSRHGWLSARKIL